MLGNELRKARLAANLSQEKLAFEADIDRTYVSHLENNKKSPTVEVLSRICKALGISTSELLRRAERAKAQSVKGKKPRAS